MKIYNDLAEKIINEEIDLLIQEKKKKKKKKKKAGTESKKEKTLRDWFGRKGAKGKKKGWVDCNAPDGDGGYKSCGRSKKEKRKRYPACRPTPSACQEKGRGESWGKKSNKKKNEGVEVLNIDTILKEKYESKILESNGDKNKSELKDIVKQLKKASKMHAQQADRISKILSNMKTLDEQEDPREELLNCGCGEDPCETFGDDNLKVMIKSSIVDAINEAKKKKKKKKKRKGKKKKKSTGKKDACYTKVKSRYKVWPSAYASGALVKCRNVGAKNWGNSKKESLEVEIYKQILEALKEV